MDPQPGHPLRHVALDDPSERLSPQLALPLVLVESVGLAVLFTGYVALDAIDSALAPLLIPPGGTMHPPAVATALVASRSSLDGLEAALALPLMLGVVVIVLVWAWLGHRLLGDRQYPQQWW